MLTNGATLGEEQCCQPAGCWCLTERTLRRWTGRHQSGDEVGCGLNLFLLFRTLCVRIKLLDPRSFSPFLRYLLIWIGEFKFLGHCFRSLIVIWTFA